MRLLERGGDDVIAKPFSYPELRARIATVLRRRLVVNVWGVGYRLLDSDRRAAI